MKWDPRDGQYKLFEVESAPRAKQLLCNRSRLQPGQMACGGCPAAQGSPADHRINEVLWSIIPKDIIFRYVRDEQLKQKGQGLNSTQEICTVHALSARFHPEAQAAFYPEPDELPQKYKQCFGNKGLH